MMITDDSLKAYIAIWSSVYVNRLVQYVQSQSNNSILEFFLSQYPFILSLVWFTAELRFSNSFTLFHAGQVRLYFWNDFKSEPRHWPESLRKMQREADLDLDSI